MGVVLRGALLYDGMMGRGKLYAFGEGGGGNFYAFGKGGGVTYAFGKGGCAGYPQGGCAGTRTPTSLHISSIFFFSASGAENESRTLLLHLAVVCPIFRPPPNPPFSEKIFFFSHSNDPPFSADIPFPASLATICAPLPSSSFALSRDSHVGARFRGSGPMRSRDASSNVCAGALVRRREQGQGFHDGGRT